jgi:hypothetical protein
MVLLAGRCDQNGFLDPGKSWLFIEWVDLQKSTALQFLWWWAQQSGARLAQRMGYTEAEVYWKNKNENQTRFREINSIQFFI